jgi:hypothetical protein
MQKVALLFLTVFISSHINAQTAIIRDPDGYCNIRQKANSQSKITDTLSNDKIVFVYKDEAEGNWLPVDYKKGKEIVSGYIHQSRIRFLTDFTKFKSVTVNDNMLKLQLDSFQLTIIKGNFNKKNRKLQYEKQEAITFLKTIDSKIPWGTDGNVPKAEYRLVQFKTEKNTLQFPVSTLNDLFEPNLYMTMAYLDTTTGNFYIEANNSDGAGSYFVIWVIKNMQISGRETFIPF